MAVSVSQCPHSLFENKNSPLKLTKHTEEHVLFSQDWCERKPGLEIRIDSKGLLSTRHGRSVKMVTTDCISQKISIDSGLISDENQLERLDQIETNGIGEPD